jgi:hypothetical protein
MSWRIQGALYIGAAVVVMNGSIFLYNYIANYGIWHLNDEMVGENLVKHKSSLEAMFNYLVETYLDSKRNELDKR